MKPFRKKVALAIDGGGIRGTIVTRALELLEKELQAPLHGVVDICAGTSTGAIISAGIASKLKAADLHRLYIDLGESIFRPGWRKALFPLTRYRYELANLELALNKYLGNPTLGDLWNMPDPLDLVMTCFDVLENRTRFIKPWKDEYKSWPLIQAVLASSSVPTYFPVVQGRFIDGGVGSYANPCFIAAFEALHVMNWQPEETTLISIGTGRSPHHVKAGQPDRWYAWDWISPMLGAFLQSADDQQVGTTALMMPNMDFRRFQVDLETPIEMDDTHSTDLLVMYGDRLAEKILTDQSDLPPDFKIMRSENQGN